MIVYRCEDTLESIFTAVYRAYEEKRNHEDTVLRLDKEYCLFGEDVEVRPDTGKADKVIRTLKRRFGEKDYEALCMALTSEAEDKAQAVYRVIVKGLQGKVPQGHLLDNLADEDSCRVFRLARAASRECHHLFGFLRFEELADGILYAGIGPKNQLLPFLMPHFAQRLPMENFLIFDEKRETWGVHPAGKEWFLVKGAASDLESIRQLSAREEQIRELFCCFCSSIAIKERENKALQRHLLPLRFREYMTEFRGRNLEK